MLYEPSTKYAHDHDQGRDLGHKYDSYLFNQATQYQDLALDISTPYFNVQGWKYLFGGNENKIKRRDLRVRLLLGAPPEDIPGKDNTEALEAFADLDAKTTRIMTDFLTWLKGDKVEIRLIRSRYHGGQSNFLHAKTYLLRSSWRENFLLRGIIGSANLTRAGMQSNEESSLFTRDHEHILTSHKMRFDRWWDTAEDYKKELIEGYEEVLRLNKPDEVYKRFLLEALPYTQPKTSVPEKYWLETPSLKAHQRSAARQLQSILEIHKGALLCDDVGLGKTYTAGALGRLTDFLKIHSVTLVYPRSIEQSWKGYLKTLDGSFQPREITYTEIARRENSDWARGSDLIILDEAHMLRNSETKQFEKVREAIRETGCRVLLLTATPVNNTLEDLHNLLSLFLLDQQLAPQGIPSLSRAFQKANFFVAKAEEDGYQSTEYFQSMQDIRLILSQVAVKRTRAYVREQHKEEKLEFPRNVESVQVEYTNSRKFDLFFEDFILNFDNSDFEGGLQMAAYSPGKYLKQIASNRKNGNDLIARSSAFLMRLTMLKKMESSLEAFEHICTTAANNTRQRLTELTNSPPMAVLADIADDDEGTILVENSDENKANNSPEISTRKPLKLTRNELEEYAHEISTYRAVLRNDLEILMGWKKRIQEMKKDEDPKLALLFQHLRRIWKEADNLPLSYANDARKVIVFSSSLHTAKYIYDHVRKSFPQSKARYVSGQTDPDERAAALQEFAPHTMLNPKEIGYNRATEDQAQILITTDVLAEGVNLQQACHVINYDLTWNPMKMLQRVGRVDRMGSLHSIVENLYFFPNPKDVDRYLKLITRLTKKMRSAEDTIGVSDSSMKTLLLEDASPDDKNYEYREDVEFVKSQQIKNFTINNKKLEENDPLIGNLQDLLFEKRAKITESEILHIKRSMVRGGFLSNQSVNEAALLIAIRNETWGSSKFFLAKRAELSPVLVEGLDLYRILLKIADGLPATNYKKLIIPEEWSYIARKLKMGQTLAQQDWKKETEEFKSAASQPFPKKSRYENAILAHLQNWQDNNLLEANEIAEVKKFVESLRNDTSDAMLIKELYHRFENDNPKDAAFSITRIINQIKARAPIAIVDYTKPPEERDLTIAAWLAFDKKILREINLI